ncbi:MAG: hybrid sensor histidine kinase/response regulator, partial [Bacteroidetes bacterium]|nr:hybrid sensor histidine kinase/response regulator [Bacteroidota bacterium]
GAISIGFKPKEKYIEFFVKDSGIGVPSNKQKAIFNRFEQADFETSLTIEGSGLGLSITKSYIEMLKGEIWLESEVGRGSIFYFTLPLHN